MKALLLKDLIHERISAIEDIHLLENLQQFLSTSDENISIFLTFINEKLQDDTLEKENFNSYIREWVKNM